MVVRVLSFRSKLGGGVGREPEAHQFLVDVGGQRHELRPSRGARTAW